MNRAVFLDRDGVINRKAPEGKYVTRWEEIEMLPNVARAIGLLNRCGFLVVVVSNQRCVAKGLLTIRDLESLHKRLSAQLAADGATIDGFYCCPHDFESSCNCRKPAPGMLLEAAKSDRIDLVSSWMIGDSSIDMEAGRSAGCKTVQVVTDGETAKVTSEVVAKSLLDAVEQILQREEVIVPLSSQA